MIPCPGSFFESTRSLRTGLRVPGAWRLGRAYPLNACSRSQSVQTECGCASKKPPRGRNYVWTTTTLFNKRLRLRNDVTDHSGDRTNVRTPIKFSGRYTYTYSHCTSQTSKAICRVRFENQLIPRRCLRCTSVREMSDQGFRSVWRETGRTNRVSDILCEPYRVVSSGL